MGQVDVVYADAFEVPRCDLGEGIIWDHRLGALLWVDPLRGALWRMVPGLWAEEFQFDSTVGFVALAGQDGYAIGLGADFALLDSMMNVQEVIPSGAPEGFILNDGGCDPFGNLVAGTIPGLALQSSAAPRGIRPHGSLYRLDRRGATELVQGVEESNGVVWPDDESMYYIDSATRRIDAWSYEKADAPHARRTLAKLTPTDGYPDGMCLDSAGNAWVAAWEGGTVHCFGADGTREKVVRVPTPLVTSCAFGGEALDLLFITTASNNYMESPVPDPESRGGRLYVADAGVVGRPEAVVKWPWR